MADKPAIAWRTTLKRRLIITAGVLLLWSAAIETRLVYLQVFRHAEYAARAERQQMRTLTAPAKRGEILDRNGRLLAYSVSASSIYAVPSEMPDLAKAVEALCGALGDCTREERREMVERFERRRAFAYVRRKASPEQVRRVAALDLEGVDFIKEDHRRYPNKELASHLLGYVGLDNDGLSGIEATYDALIKGKPGRVLIQTDARRHVFSRVEKPPTAGASLELTIDEYLQHIVERELKAGVLENRAASGSAVVMNPWTGEILALANYPTFNPNAYQKATTKARRNRAIQDLYEPGSTFKIVTASAALEQQVIDPDDMVDTTGGAIRFGSDVVRDTHDYGVLSFTDVIVKSSNVGAIKVALRLGAERLTSYVKRFGFGTRSSPDFPAETPGIVWEASKLKDRSLARVAIGYQVGVNALQMAAAVSSIANGGELIQPRVVRSVIRDGQRIPVPRKIMGRTVDANVAAELTAMMEDVVERGTATYAKMDNYTVAGKTGTASKLVNGAYSRSDYNSSFVGFVPSRKPVFTIVVVIDSAHGPNGHYGGPVAAPIFKRIAGAALRHEGVPPTLNAPPPVLVARNDEPRERPVFGPVAPPAVLALNAAARHSEPVVPELTGMSARDALRLLARLGMNTRMHGTGLVIDQTPAAGTAVEAGLTATLWLGRRFPDTTEEREAP